MDFFAGIDPGKTGGLCLLRPRRRGSGLEVVEGMAMPGTDAEVVAVLAEWLPKCRKVFVEAVPKFAGENRSAAFMCVLFGNYRTITGAVSMWGLLHGKDVLAEMPLLLWMNRIIPQAERSRDRALRKAQLKAESERRWPEWKWTAATCDAPLIAEAGYLLGR